ncbi:MAG: NADPH:quinone oxidoreductase family protein [Desulfobacterales bacterium]|nr:NADPH:quinone oxidoreductase family protein [Desulfobacterales bacterium]
MKALLCMAFGDESNLKLGDAPAPVLGANQVRIAVKAAGMNFADTLFISGAYQVKLVPPFIPGVEVAGVVLEVAPGVTTCKPGDRVLGMMVDAGAYAEEAVLDATAAVVIPDMMDFVDAAGFPGSWGTSYHSLTTRARLKAGETLLVHGAGSGVGLTAVAVGRQMGATVIATAGSAEKLALARAQGASHLINYKEEDFRTRVKELTGGRGADVIFDPIGGKTFESSLRCVAPHGRILVIGFAGGVVQQIPANLVLVKNVDIVGYSWGACWHQDATSGREALQALLAWYAQGKITSHVTQHMPLADAAKAIGMIKRREVMGKMVLTV